jgi:1-deoxy-D-xylulose-5-phosphate reductoisomerase
MASGAQALDFRTLGALTFEVPDRARFPGLFLSWDALRGPQGTTAVLNAANEVAVAAFLDGRLRFDRIAQLNAHTLEAVLPGAVASVADLLDLDAQARRCAEAAVERYRAA